MASRGWMGSGWLSPVEAVGGDLRRLGLLRCRGGGPQGAAEDEGLSVLLGDRSMRRKGSTGACGGVAHRAEEEKGKGGSGLAHGEGEKKGGGGVQRLGATWRSAWGGMVAGKARGQRTWWLVSVCRAMQGSGRHAWAARERVGRLRKMR
jgi:hypothetical protein